MKKRFPFYTFVYYLVAWIFYTVFGLKVTGRENVPEGPAVVCSPHSSFMDPLILAVGVKRRNMLRFMAKKELFDNKILKPIVTGLGAFPVDRGNRDVTAIKTAMQLLREGEKIAIFPEGTRVSEDDAVAAKTGAVRIADRCKVPVLPIYLQRRKRPFRRTRMVIGKPYTVNDKGGRPTSEDYHRMADALMAQMQQLGRNA